MKYKIVISDQCAKHIKKKLKGKEGLTMLRKVSKDLIDDPYGKSSKVKNPKLPSRKYRVGKYRVLFDIEGEVVIILAIDHRKDVYDN